MDNKYRNKVLIIIGVIIGIISILAIILSFFVKKDKTPDDKPPIDEPTLILKKDIERLNDEDTFFTIQNILNEYYELVTSNSSKLNNIVDPDYLKNNTLSSLNPNNFKVVNFTPEKIYYNPGSSITYYFITGSVEDLDMLLDESTFYKNINNLLIVDERTNKYVIRPISNNINIEDYAKNYNILEKEITSDYTFNKTTIKEENKLTLYLNNYKSLLISDPEKAYSILTDAAKGKYDDYNDFYSNIESIYERLSTKIFGISKKENGKQNIYNIIDDNQNNIIIYENNIMDYKIYF